MKKAIIIAAVTISITLSVQAFNSGVFVNNMVEENVEIIDEPTETPSDDTDETTEEVGLVYINTEMDFFSFIDEPGWYYESYDDLVIFYNSYSAYSYNSIAVSSYMHSVSEEDRASQTEYYMEQATANLEQIIENLSVTKIENFIFGEFEAYRYYFTGHYSSDDVDIAGEYMYWWIEDREYTCSLFCTADEYENFSTVMHDFLNNFQQPSTMN